MKIKDSDCKWIKQDFIDSISKNYDVSYEMLQSMLYPNKQKKENIDSLKAAIKELQNADNFTHLFDMKHVFNDDRIQAIHNIAECYDWSFDDITENDYSLLFRDYIDSMNDFIHTKTKECQERLNQLETDNQIQKEQKSYYMKNWIGLR